MRVNIIIAKRDRHEHLKMCLHYLNNCCADKSFRVSVYVVDDSVNGITYTPYPNFNLVYLPYPNSGIFNKSKLINYALSKMDDFDWFSLVDVDMIYAADFLSRIQKKITLNYEYIVSHGYKMGKTLSEYTAANLPPIEYITSASDITEFRVGPSQITMTKRTYQRFLDVFGSPLYDEFYEGWGAEDSDISVKSVLLRSRHMLLKDEVYNLWYHIFHEGSNVDAQQYQKNCSHLRERYSQNYLAVSQRYGGGHYAQVLPQHRNPGPRR